MTVTATLSAGLIGVLVSTTVGLSSYLITTDASQPTSTHHMHYFPSVQKQMLNRQKAGFDPMKCMSGPWNVCWQATWAPGTTRRR